MVFYFRHLNDRKPKGLDDGDVPSSTVSETAEEDVFCSDSEGDDQEEKADYAKCNF